MVRRNVRSMVAGLVAFGALLGSEAPADELRVVASIKPVHSLVAGVMQGVGEPTLLLEGAASPHTYSLRPSEARALAGADVVFWIGGALETFLVKPLDALSADARVVELAASRGLTLLPARESGMRPTHPPDSHAEDADAEPAGEAAQHDERPNHVADRHHGHGDGTPDMHLWLDPHNARAMLDRIASVLSESDPRNADAYATNAAALRQRLAELDGALRASLAPVRDRPFVVFHDAYQYFEHRYRVSAAGSITINPERPPGAGRLSEIRAALETLGAACVFTEPQFEPALVDTIVEGTEAGTGTLDPLGARIEPGPDMYFELMSGLAGAMADCLGTLPPG